MEGRAYPLTFIQADSLVLKTRNLSSKSHQVLTSGARGDERTGSPRAEMEVTVCKALNQREPTSEKKC
jgi:hypothetical protein